MTLRLTLFSAMKGRGVMLIPLPRRETELDIEGCDSRIVVHDRKHDYVHVLNERALAVLQACDGKRSCNEIARTLSYPAGEIAHLVTAFADLALVKSDALSN
jgi:hypothetical protein